MLGSVLGAKNTTVNEMDSVLALEETYMEIAECTNRLQCHRGYKRGITGQWGTKVELVYYTPGEAFL